MIWRSFVASRCCSSRPRKGCGCFSCRSASDGGVGRVAGLRRAGLRHAELVEEHLLQLLRRTEVDLAADLAVGLLRRGRAAVVPSSALSAVRAGRSTVTPVRSMRGETGVTGSSISVSTRVLLSARRSRWAATTRPRNQAPVAGGVAAVSGTSWFGSVSGRLSPRHALTSSARVCGLEPGRSQPGGEGRVPDDARERQVVVGEDARRALRVDDELGRGGVAEPLLQRRVIGPARGPVDVHGGRGRGAGGRGEAEALEVPERGIHHEGDRIAGGDRGAEPGRELLVDEGRARAARRRRGRRRRPRRTCRRPRPRRSSARARVRVRNCRRSKMLFTAGTSIGPRSRSSGPTGSSTSVSRRLSRRLRSARSRCSRRLLPTTPPISSACSSRFSREPYWVIHFTAVFSPTLSMPGRLSLVSPTRAAISGYCSGSMP